MSLLLVFVSDTTTQSVQAVTLNPDGSLTYKLAYIGVDRIIYLNGGQYIGRLTGSVDGDKLVTLVNGLPTASPP